MGDLGELQPPVDAAGRRRLRRLTNLLDQPVHAGRNPPPQHVWHCSVHNHPSDPPLSDQQWAHIATEIVAAVGLAPHGDLQAVRWIAIRTPPATSTSLPPWFARTGAPPGSGGTTRKPRPPAGSSNSTSGSTK
jgi:hypothetical protein